MKRCIDSRSYKNSLGMSCINHKDIKCSSMHIFGLSSSEVSVLINKCPFSCKTCKKPTRIPTMSPTREDCRDDKSFADKFGSPCVTFTGLQCHVIGWLGYTLDEIQQILDSCPESCGVCVIPIPSESPSDHLIFEPTLLPTIEPTKAPVTLTGLPSVILSNFPNVLPSNIPSYVKSYDPSYAPSYIPTGIPSNSPSNVPSDLPSVSSSIILSSVPSYAPSATRSINSIPSYALTSDNIKTAAPSGPKKTAVPSWSPSTVPSGDPSTIPSVVPVEIPSETPSEDPSGNPKIIPSTSPSAFSTSISVEIPIDTKTVSVSVVPSSIKTLAPTNKVISNLPKPNGSQILGVVEGRDAYNSGNTINNDAQSLFLENIMAGVIAGMSIALIALVSYTLNRGKVRKKMKSQESSQRKQKQGNNFEEGAQIEDSADSDENYQSELSDVQPEVKLENKSSMKSIESADLKSGKRKERREKEQQKVQQNSVESSKLHVKQKKFRKESQSSSDEFKEDPKLLHESLEGSQLMSLSQDAEDRTIKSILKKRNPSSSDIDLLLTPNSYSSDSDFELVDGDRILSMISSSKENSNESFGFYDSYVL